MERIKHFPVPFFAVVMGIAGLAIAFQKAHHLFGAPKIIYEGLMFFAAFAFVAISAFYMAKLYFFPEEVKKDFLHPIRVNFFAAISISLLLLGINFYFYFPLLAVVLWSFGTLIHLFMTFYVVSFWIRNNFEIIHTNPAWFIPIVGNVLVPIVGVDLLPKEVSLYFLSVGLFFWVLLGTIIFYRIIFHHQMPQKFIPTLFIFIAPPAVGFVSYIKIFGAFDFNAMFLLNIALFFTTLLFFMGKSFSRLKFFISWWAFTFPLDAVSIAFMTAYQITHSTIYAIFGGALLFIATLVVGYVALITIKNIKRREICVEE
jgi:tellurite resistance protein